MPEDAGWKKWGALVVFAVQNAGAVLLMRYSKLLHGPPYSNLAAVMVQELIKLGVSTVLYANECRGLGAMVEALRADLQENSGEWLQLAVPSLLYTLQAERAHHTSSRSGPAPVPGAASGARWLPVPGTRLARPCLARPCLAGKT